MRARILLLGSFALLACPSDGDSMAGEGSSTTESSEGSSTTDEAASSSTTGSDPGSSSGDDEAESGSTGEPTPQPTWGEPETLPTPDGVCPTFESGTLEFAPGEIAPRQARVWYDPESGGGGPLVFYWHGTGSSPMEAEYGLGQDAIDDILMRGGMVVAPVHDPEAGQFPWYLVLSEEENDIHLMDEIVGCAAEGPGIDPSHIHAIGMSAGGLQTTQVSIRRASYVASVVTYSGGLLNPETPSDDPERPFPAMIYHGGPDDVVVISFQQASERYQAHIAERGGYSIICDHGGGHSIPDARVRSWQFMLDHPFDIAPFPYQGNLPDWVPDYCVE